MDYKKTGSPLDLYSSLWNIEEVLHAWVLFRFEEEKIKVCFLHRSISWTVLSLQIWLHLYSVFGLMQRYEFATSPRRDNAKVMEYHDANRKSVRKTTRWDILNLQYLLPDSVLKFPYEILNRMNWKALYRQEGNKINDITHEDFPLINDTLQVLDLFYMLIK